MRNELLEGFHDIVRHFLKPITPFPVPIHHTGWLRGRQFDQCVSPSPLWIAWSFYSGIFCPIIYLVPWRRMLYDYKSVYDMIPAGGGKSLGIDLRCQYVYYLLTSVSITKYDLTNTTLLENMLYFG